jgi:RNA polymerase sigma-70 factor (ECF subfamily)
LVSQIKIFWIFTLHTVAEELTQDAFIKAWKALPEFGLRSSLKTWIYQVAINVGRDWLRSHKTRNIDLSESNEEGNDSPTQEQLDIQEAILELEDDVREILVLFYFEGMKQEELSAILKVPSGTIKSRLHSARTKLKERLLHKGYDV